MMEGNLSNLAWLLTEHKLRENLNYNHKTGDSPVKKARKVNFIE